MKIIVSEFITLDGVIDSPDQWVSPFLNDSGIGQFINQTLVESDAELYGGTTYKEFASAWLSRTGEFADRMNNLPKYVVSTSLDKLPW